MRLDNKSRFIIFHFLFLLSFIAIYYIPLICSMVKDANLPPLNRYMRFYMLGIFSLTFLFYYLLIYYHSKIDISLYKANKLSVYFWLTNTAIFFLLCTSYPLLSGDLFDFPLRGRMITLYGLNPYVNTPMDIRHDMFFPFVFWKAIPVDYGPVWTIIGSLHTVFFKNSFILTVFMHKAVLLIFLLLSCYVFYKICLELKLQNSDALTTAFVANPLLITATLIDGHVEVVMIFFILAAIYLVLRSKYLLSFLTLTLAAQTKIIYILIIPLWILFILLRTNGKSLASRIYTIIMGSILSTAAVVILWLPFGKRAIINVFNYYRDLNADLYSNTIPYAAYFFMQRLGIHLSKYAIAGIFFITFFTIYVYLIYYFITRIKTDRQAIFTASGFIILTLLFTTSTPFNSWYILWAIHFLLLSRLNSKFLLTFLLSYFMLIAFWKRMFVLVVPMLVLYFFMLAIYNRYEKKLKFIFSLQHNNQMLPKKQIRV